MQEEKQVIERISQHHLSPEDRHGICVSERRCLFIGSNKIFDVNL